MNILFLTPRIIYPLIGGDRIKPYYILSHLAKQHNVSLVTFHQGQDSPEERIKKIEELGVNVHVIPLNPVIAGLRCAYRAMNHFPLEISYYYQPAYQKVVDTIIKEQKIDLGFAFFMRTAEYIKNASFKKILMSEDCRVLYQFRSYSESRNFKQRLIRIWEYKKLMKYEPEIVNHFDLTTLVTQTDLDAMKKQNSSVKYDLLSNGTNIDIFKPSVEYSQRKGILFVGKLDVWANVLMVDRIINHIFPLIKSKVPNSVLNIVGAKPTKQLFSLVEEKKDINIIANVPDILPYFQNAELFLHPHNAATGIQNKLLEAMACGCTVVTTKSGNQGIDAVHGRDLLIGNSNEEMADYAIKLMTDKEYGSRISQNSRNFIVENHSWQKIFSSLDRIIEEMMSK